MPTAISIGTSKLALCRRSSLNPDSDGPYKAAAPRRGRKPETKRSLCGSISSATEGASSNERPHKHGSCSEHPQTATGTLVVLATTLLEWRMSTSEWCSVTAIPLLGHESRAAWVVLSFQISVTSCLGECGIRHPLHVAHGARPLRRGRDRSQAQWQSIHSRTAGPQVGGRAMPGPHRETRGLARSSSSCLRHKSTHFESSSSLMYSPRARVCAQLSVAVSPSYVARPNRQVRGCSCVSASATRKTPLLAILRG